MSATRQSVDWAQIEQEYLTSAPWNAAVIDEFLEPSVLEELRRDLAAHWNWSHKDWKNRHLRNLRPNLAAVKDLGAEILEKASWLAQESYELFDFWALMQTETRGAGTPHWDRYGVTISIWLTENYNADPDNGGVLLYDVKHRREDRSSATPEELRELIEERSRGRLLRIPYRPNRAVILDSRTVHRTDDFLWNASGPGTQRINLAFSYATPAQIDEYKDSLTDEGAQP
jgi:hypothetical protein